VEQNDERNDEGFDSSDADSMKCRGNRNDKSGPGGEHGTGRTLPTIPRLKLPLK